MSRDGVVCADEGRDHIPQGRLSRRDPDRKLRDPRPHSGRGFALEIGQLDSEHRQILQNAVVQELPDRLPLSDPRLKRAVGCGSLGPTTVSWQACPQAIDSGPPNKTTLRNPFHLARMASRVNGATALSLNADQQSASNAVSRRIAVHITKYAFAPQELMVKEVL